MRFLNFFALLCLYSGYIHAGGRGKGDIKNDKRPYLSHARGGDWNVGNEKKIGLLSPNKVYYRNCDWLIFVLNETRKLCMAKIFVTLIDLGTDIYVQ